MAINIQCCSNIERKGNIRFGWLGIISIGQDVPLFIPSYTSLQPRHLFLMPHCISFVLLQAVLKIKGWEPFHYNCKKMFALMPSH